MQAGERELHLGLDARRSRDATPGRPLLQVVQQRGLADPRLAAQDQHPALTRPHLVQEPIQHPPLADLDPAIQAQHDSWTLATPTPRGTVRDALYLAWPDRQTPLLGPAEHQSSD